MQENNDSINENSSKEEKTLNNDSINEKSSEEEINLNNDSINENSSKEEKTLNNDSINEKSSEEEINLNNDSINENSSKKEKTLNNVPIDNNFNDQSNLINKDSAENALKPNDQNGNKVVNNVIKSEKKEPITSNDIKIKPKKEIPIEKKPFNEFVIDHLLPCIIKEFKERGFEVNDINLKNTSRPIAGDKCWVIYCEIKDTCNFWLSFEKDDITSLKSISLCKYNQTPSVIESFLIDEKRITLKLIISRILQRLNGQKLIGIN